jgi:hypothetical protein
MPSFSAMPRSYRRVSRGAAALLALALLLAALPAGRAQAFKTVECQHPVMTGVEVFKLHDISSARACPVALALFHWESGEDHEATLYGCRGVVHPFLRLHRFDGWRLSLTPYFEMSRGDASFAVSGTDFPLNCS